MFKGGVALIKICPVPVYLCHQLTDKSCKKGKHVKSDLSFTQHGA